LLLLLFQNYRAFPAFTFYFLLNLAISFLFFAAYHRWAFAAPADWRVGWACQALSVCARALAVAEVCRLILARYAGVWALASRILWTSGALVLLYSLVASKWQWVSALPSAERGLNLAIASVIAGIFFFARYYDVSVAPAVRNLALGFFLYSCFGVLNNTILERWLYGYSELWNILNSVASGQQLSMGLGSPQAVSGNRAEGNSFAGQRLSFARPGNQPSLALAE
jgi:hypothetical protein